MPRGLHADDRRLQQRLEGRTERSRSVMDRGGRSTLGPVRSRPELGGLPSRPATADESRELRYRPFIALHIGGTTSVAWPIPTDHIASLVISQFDLLRQGHERGAQDPQSATDGKESVAEGSEVRKSP